MRVSLKCQSSKEWSQEVLGNFNTFLADHADCERKAAATAMSLISRFPDKPELVEPMVSLAREELAHFHLMYKLCKKREVAYEANQKDPYIEQLRKCIRHSENEYFLDRLLVSGIIEARAHERLASIAPQIEDQELNKIYHKLAREEEAHESIFTRLACQYFSEEVVEARLTELVDVEARILNEIPVRAAIH